MRYLVLILVILNATVSSFANLGSTSNLVGIWKVNEWQSSSKENPHTFSNWEIQVHSNGYLTSKTGPGNFIYYIEPNATQVFGWEVKQYSFKGRITDVLNIYYSNDKPLQYSLENSFNNLVLKRLDSIGYPSGAFFSMQKVSNEVKYESNQYFSPNGAWKVLMWKQSDHLVFHDRMNVDVHFLGTYITSEGDLVLYNQYAGNKNQVAYDSMSILKVRMRKDHTSKQQIEVAGDYVYDYFYKDDILLLNRVGSGNSLVLQKINHLNTFNIDELKTGYAAYARSKAPAPPASAQRNISNPKTTESELWIGLGLLFLKGFLESSNEPYNSKTRATRSCGCCNGSGKNYRTSTEYYPCGCCQGKGYLN